MEIRRAEQQDLEGINHLLRQVLNVHQKGRPDIFKANAKKYTDNELLEIIKDETKPIFVAILEERLVGYAFCVFHQEQNSNILTDIKSLYIDDLCVDETIRGMGIGKALYRHVVEFAKKSQCYNLTLNVWSCNPDAMKFYEKMGLQPQKISMETIL